jgi:hypothetical protein
MMMTVRQANFGLWATAAMLFALAIGALVAGIAMPVRLETQTVEIPQTGSRAPTTVPDSLERYEIIWSRSLRALDVHPGSLIATAAPASQPSDVPLTLVGTVGRSLALLRLADGTVEVISVGETLAGAQVLSIQPARVELEYNGKIVTLLKRDDPLDGGSQL